MAWPKGVKRGPRKVKDPTMTTEPPPTVVQPASKGFAKGQSRWGAADPNWETPNVGAEDDVGMGKLHIPKELVPDGFDVQYITDSVYGKEVPQHRAGFERKGWTPVHAGDLEGSFDYLVPKGHKGEINVDGLVLMYRPKHLSDKAKARDQRLAREQVAIKEQALTGQGLDVLGGDHPSARKSNFINRSVERIEVVRDKD